MKFLYVLATTFREALSEENDSIYSGLYNVVLPLLQGVFSILNRAGIYVAGCVISMLAAGFIVFGRNSKALAELKEESVKKLFVIVCMFGVVNIIGLLFAVSQNITFTY